MAWTRKAQFSESVDNIRTFTRSALTEFESVMEKLKTAGMQLSDAESIWPMLESIHGSLTVLFNEAQELNPHEASLVTQGQRKDYVRWQLDQIRLALKNLVSSQEAKQLSEGQQQALQLMLSEVQGIEDTIIDQGNLAPAQAAEIDEVDPVEAPSIKDPEMQGLTDEDKEKLRSIEIDYYDEGPYEQGNENNESALKVKVSNGRIEATDWVYVSPEEIPDMPEDKRIRSIGIETDLLELLEDTNRRGNYTGDVGLSAKEIIALPPDEQQKALIGVAISALAYGSDERLVDALGE